MPHHQRSKHHFRTEREVGAKAQTRPLAGVSLAEWPTQPQTQVISPSAPTSPPARIRSTRRSTSPTATKSSCTQTTSTVSSLFGHASLKKLAAGHVSSRSCLQKTGAELDSQQSRGTSTPHFHMHSHCTVPTTCVPWLKGLKSSRRIVCQKTFTHPRVMFHLAPHNTLNTSTSSLSPSSPVLLSSSSLNPDLLSTHPFIHCGDPRQDCTSTEFHSSTKRRSRHRRDSDR